eukprot:TRINITY_DN9745_c0_g1_i1.p1 TRINITY_DN9745_c0_g1~~TRINITY_DN9745_c0_g1_i1.p1  ORF type:complete len:112 (+),score=3.51 TRINITY_DN9745_c0_g1_i1:339-674(+)
MVEAIEYLHSKHICHYDVSLENLLINDIEVAFNESKQMLSFCYDEKNMVQTKLCDFGLAERFEIGPDKQSDFMSSKFCGKQFYQSPECAERKQPFDAAKMMYFVWGFLCLC